VTVLFADLVGFTGRAERLDPEDVRATLLPYYTSLRGELERYGGTVEKFIGDAVMALFGAPSAHEDDPERAVRAALAIRDALAEPSGVERLDVRVGITTGEALVALGVRVAEGEGMASGDVVNSAARLQVSAPVNGILVDEATYWATRALIEYEPVEPVEAKGKAAPIRAWAAVGARSRFGIDVPARQASRLVGRERELAALRDLLRRCRDELTLQLLTLVGVPGIGKSRLVAELLAIVDAEPELIWWRQGRSLPYGEGSSYWALGEIVKAQAGISENDPVDAASGKLHAMVDDVVGNDACAWVEGHLRPLIGVGIVDRADHDTRHEAFSAWRRLIESLAEQRPAVLVFEDLHWADDGLLDFIDYLAEWVTGVPVLLVCTARPELLDRRPGWGGGKRNATTMSVAPLTPPETASLLADRLEQTLLPAEVQAKVLLASEGNPLYAEEFTRMLQDRGFLVRGAGGWQLEDAGELPLPANVQATIAARLDGLRREEKELVQDASVIGKVFWPAALERLVGRPAADLEAVLHALERKEFIRRERRSAIAGEQQYAFLHALVRDVAYGQIPRGRRIEKHRSAAEWIESLASDRTEDRSDMLAHHYLEALELARVTGVDIHALREPAIAASLEAANRAAALNGWPAARQHARAAIELMDDGDPRRPHAMFTELNASWMLGEPTIDPHIETRDAFLAVGDTQAAAMTETLLSRLYWLQGERDSYEEHGLRSMALAEELPPTLTKARILAARARVMQLSDRSTAGLELARQALAIAETAADPSLVSRILTTSGMARVHLGDAGGIDDLERAVSLAEMARAPDDLHTALNNLANMHWRLGQLDAARTRHEQARQADEQYGYSAGLHWLLAERLFDRMLRGEWNEALPLAEAVLAEHDTVTSYLHVPALLMRALIETGRNQLDAALADSDLALTGARRSQDAQQLAPTMLGRAQALLASGRINEANQLIDELLEDADLADCWLHELPLVLYELGRRLEYVAALEGDERRSPWLEAGLAAATDRLDDAANMYEQIGARAAEARARLLHAESTTGTRNERNAIQELGDAVGYFGEVGAAYFVRRCHALLRASASGLP